MGAEFDFYTYRGAISKLGDHHQEMQQERCYEQGNDTYAGHLGILPDGLQLAKCSPFKTVEAAVEYLEDNHSKWSCAMAVPFKTQGQDYDRASRKLLEQQAKAEAELEQAEKDILREIKSTRSKTVGCRGCTSSISRAHLHSLNCPVCSKGDGLLTQTQRQALLRKKNKHLRLRSKKLQLTEQTITAYAVGGWCAA